MSMVYHTLLEAYSYSLLLEIAEGKWAHYTHGLNSLVSTNRVFHCKLWFKTCFFCDKRLKNVNISNSLIVKDTTFIRVPVPAVVQVYFMVTQGYCQEFETVSATFYLFANMFLFFTPMSANSKFSSVQVYKNKAKRLQPIPWLGALRQRLM